MLAKLKSRKLWATFASSALVLFGDTFGVPLTPDQLLALAAIVGSYVLGQGYADGQGAK